MTTRSRQASPDRAKSDPAAHSQPPPAPPQQIPPPLHGNSLRAPAASHTAPSLRHPQSVLSAQLSFRLCPIIRLALNKSMSSCANRGSSSSSSRSALSASRILWRGEGSRLARKPCGSPLQGRHNTKQISGALALEF